MFKKRNISIYNNLKTSFFCKFSLILGIMLLFIFVFFKLSSLLIGENSTGVSQIIYDLSQSVYMEIAIAFSIIFLGVGVILYFFNCQFAKLAEITKELEDEENEETESISDS